MRETPEFSLLGVSVALRLGVEIWERETPKAAVNAPQSRRFAHPQGHSERASVWSAVASAPL